GSTEVTLRPGVVTGGEYEFAIETAGPVTLLFQALLPAMVASRQRFSLTLRGGTNVAWAPQWDDLVLTHAPPLRQLGVAVAIALAAECDRTVLGADAVGRKGVRLESVVEEATARLRAELRAGVGVDAHQADQLPVVMALAGGGSFTCRMLSPHARTVLDLLP